MTKNSRSHDESIAAVDIGVALLTSVVGTLRRSGSSDFASFVKSALQSVVMSPAAATATSTTRRLLRSAALIALVLIGGVGLLGAGFVGGEFPAEAPLEAGIIAAVVVSTVGVPSAVRRRRLPGEHPPRVVDVASGGSNRLDRRPADPPTTPSVRRRGPPAHAPISFVLA